MKLDHSVFRYMLITVTGVFSAILIWAILSLMLMPKAEDVIQSALSEEMLYSIKLSLITSSISVVIVMLIAICAGYTLARYSFPGHHLLRTLVDLPMAFPELVLGLCLLLLFGHGPLSKLLINMGINIVFSRPAIAIAQIFTAAPYAIRISFATFRNINKRYELVARSLGYSEFKTFLNVTLPMAKGGLLAATVISFARCTGCFGTVLILAGGTRMFTEILPITLYLNISYGNLAMAMTSGIILILISLGAILIFEMLNKEIVV